MKYLPYTTPLLTAAMLSSCQVARESVVASVDNVLGISVAQNHQSQLYEAKAGYVRSQFYLIPTGKTIENDPNKPLQEIHTAADVAPEVVSAVSVESGIEQLVIGMKAKELFAVGTTAVNSKAAIAMFISNAEDTNQSTQAANALKGFKEAGKETTEFPVPPTGE